LFGCAFAGFTTDPDAPTTDSHERPKNYFDQFYVYSPRKFAKIIFSWGGSLAKFGLADEDKKSVLESTCRMN
jgi:hypothetical protein